MNYFRKELPDVTRKGFQEETPERFPEKSYEGLPE